MPLQRSLCATLAGYLVKNIPIQDLGIAMEIRLLGPGDKAILTNAAPNVFDNAIQPSLLSEFLSDPRHHVVVALEDQKVIGFASAVDYVHPDKPRELWVNEIGVTPSHRRNGVATRMLRALLDAGRALGCRQAWVLTDASNAPAMRLYSGAGGVQAPDQTVMFEFDLDEVRPPVESQGQRI